jgi:predicted amidohydrolase YtcJ
MWFSEYTPGEVLGPRLRLAGVKFFIDGCTAKHMLMTQPRAYDPKYYGNFFWGRAELRRMVRRVHEAGWQIAAHTCGDAAADELLDALELAFGKEEGSQFRARIEHALALRDDQIRRMRRMGVSPSFQLTWADSDWKKSFRREFDAEQRELLGRWRDLAEDPRLHPMGSTDTPYGEDFPELEPTTVMDALAQATTRIHEPRQHPARYMLEQRLTVMEAIRLLTIDGAYGIFAEDDLGSITRGKLADFVVLSQDPRDVRVRRLESIDVAVVVVGGRQEVCASGYEDSCLRASAPDAGIASL